MASYQKTYQRGADQSTDKPLGVQVHVRLKGHSHTETCRTQAEARSWATRVEASIREFRCLVCQEEKSARDPAQTRTVAELLTKYQTYLEGKAPKTLDSRRGHLAVWRHELGKISLGELSRVHIAAARDKLESQTTRRGTPRSAGHTNRLLATLSHALTVAVREWDWLDSNPMRKVQKLSEPQGRIRFLSDDERGRLLAACKQSPARWLHPMVMLALATGMREGEILGLTWDRLDLEAGRIRLDNTKNKERRGVSIEPHTLAMLREYARVRVLGSPLVFSREDQPRPVHLRGPWAAVVKAAGLEDFRFHDLRHTAASYLAMSGASPGEIAAVLGHKTLAMVKRYAHLSDAHTAGVVAKLGERLFGGNP